MGGMFIIVLDEPYSEDFIATWSKIEVIDAVCYYFFAEVNSFELFELFLTWYLIKMEMQLTTVYGNNSGQIVATGEWMDFILGVLLV